MRAWWVRQQARKKPEGNEEATTGLVRCALQQAALTPRPPTQPPTNTHLAASLVGHLDRGSSGHTQQGCRTRHGTQDRQGRTGEGALSCAWGSHTGGCVRSLSTPKPPGGRTLCRQALTHAVHERCVSPVLLEQQRRVGQVERQLCEVESDGQCAAALVCSTQTTQSMGV